MQNNVLKKMQEIVESKFEGKTIVKSKAIIFPKEPTSCVENNMFFIVCQKNKVVKIKSKNIELLLAELYSLLKDASLMEDVMVSSNTIDALLAKYNFTYSKDKFIVAVDNILKDKIINNCIFGFNVNGDCVVIKKMWVESSESTHKKAKIPTVTFFAKRNNVYASINNYEELDIKNLNKSKYKIEDGCIVCNYKNFNALNLEKFVTNEESLDNIFKVVCEGKEDFVSKITKTIEEKQKNELCEVINISLKK